MARSVFYVFHTPTYRKYPPHPTPILRLKLLTQEPPIGSRGSAVLIETYQTSALLMTFLVSLLYIMHT